VTAQELAHSAADLRRQAAAGADATLQPHATSASATNTATATSPACAVGLAAAVAIVAALTGWRGTDLPAQLYRVTMFHRVGLSLWDAQWFGGHWALAYSVLYPPVAATLGVTVTSVLSAAGAALAFERLVTPRFGRAGTVGAVLFALGTAQQLAIGQLSFLMAEALALAACWAGTRRRWRLAAALSLAAALTSPLAGAFLAIAGVAFVVAASPGERARAALVLVGALAPLCVVAVMFSDAGPFPFSFVDFTFDLCVAAVACVVAPKGLRLVAALYAALTVACFAVHNPVGGNVGRLAECIAIPFGACVLWQRRRLVFVALAAPMALAVWVPAWGAMTGRVSASPSAHRAYYAPLLAFLGPVSGRVEVVPTEYHWEAAYVATTVPLARGWERQLDIARDPLFYDGRLDATRYRAWLVAHGVRFVALPDAPLDMAGRAEAKLVEAGVPGLSPVWDDAHWQVYAVDGSPGIVSGPARLVRMDGSHIRLDADAPGLVTVRVAGGAHWQVAHGAACAVAANGAVVVQVREPGPVDLTVRPGTRRCQPRNPLTSAATSSGRS
jgi:hypothetical protein